MRVGPPGLVVAALLSGACGYFRRDPPRPDAARTPSPEQVTLDPTSDRWTIRGTLSAGRSPERAVILVHQLASSRREWQPLQHRLALEPAVTTLAIDLRGHGASVTGPLGGATPWTSFGTDAEAWAGVERDVAAAMSFLARRGARRVVCVGSSIGASACARVAAERREAVGLVLISPGLRYHGLEVRDAFTRFLAIERGTRRAMLLGTAGDAPVAEAIPALSSLGAGAVESELYAGERRHGVSLCNTHSERWDRVEGFIRTALDARRAVTPSRDGGG